MTDNSDFMTVIMVHQVIIIKRLSVQKICAWATYHRNITDALRMRPAAFYVGLWIVDR